MDALNTYTDLTGMDPLTYTASRKGRTLIEPYHSILLWIGEYWYIMAVLLYALIQYWKEKNLL